MSHFCRMVALFAIVLAATAIPSNLSAQDPRRVLFDGVIEGVRITVEIEPANPQPEIVVFFVRPVTEEGNFPILDAAMRIVVERPDGSELYQSPLLNSRQSPEMYFGRITFDQIGTWPARVELQSDEMASLVYEFSLEIEPLRTASNAAAGLVFVGVIVVIVGGVIIIWLTNRKRRSPE